MFRYDRTIQRATRFGGIFILLTAGCSSGADRASTRDSAAAMTTGTAALDSTPATSSDTAPGRAPADSTTAPRTQSAAVAQTPAPKPRIRPSIDPGRKSTTTPPPRPASAVRDTAAADTAAAAASSSNTAPASASGSSQDQNLKYDAATNTVTFQLIGGPSGFQFNGYSSGGATLTLPPNATVVMNFINKDGTPHSAEVIPGEGPIPNGAGDPAIPRAYTNKALEGLPQEGTDVMQFPAPASGS